ncbi:MAG: metal-dependent hydrolase [Pseudomonadota bacterium]
MNTITVRKVDFDFPEDAGLYAIPSMPRVSLFIAAFSLTMPYLEPYLIRMMLVAGKEVTDPGLAEDIKRFSQQEGNHYRNHARINKIVRSHFDEATQAELLAIEADLKADYENFLKNRPLKFNLAYAEGFEAMTCAAALPAARREGPMGLSRGWDELLDWHALEEVEHRTVAFDTYEHLAGGYLYRVFTGLKAQVHYLYYIHRFYRVMLKAKGMRVYPYIPFFILAGGWRYLNTFMPWYNPANYEVPTTLQSRLAAYETLVHE